MGKKYLFLFISITLFSNQGALGGKISVDIENNYYTIPTKLLMGITYKEQEDKESVDIIG